MHLSILGLTLFILYLCVGGGHGFEEMGRVKQELEHVSHWVRILFWKSSWSQDDVEDEEALQEAGRSQWIFEETDERVSSISECGLPSSVTGKKGKKGKGNNNFSVSLV